MLGVFIGGFLTICGSVISEIFRHKREVKLEKLRLFTTERIDSMKRIIAFARELEKCLDITGNTNTRHYSSTFKEMFFNKIELDAAYHNKTIRSYFDKLLEFYGEIEIFMDVGLDYEDVQAHIHKELYKQTDGLRSEAINVLTGLNLT